MRRRIALLLALGVGDEMTTECLGVPTCCHSPCPIFSDTLNMRISELPQFVEWKCLYGIPYTRRGLIQVRYIQSKVLVSAHVLSV